MALIRRNSRTLRIGASPAGAGVWTFSAALFAVLFLSPAELLAQNEGASSPGTATSEQVEDVPSYSLFDLLFGKDEEAEEEPEAPGEEGSGATDPDTGEPGIADDQPVQPQRPIDEAPLVEETAPLPGPVEAAPLEPDEGEVTADPPVIGTDEPLEAEPGGDKPLFKEAQSLPLLPRRKPDRADGEGERPGEEEVPEAQNGLPKSPEEEGGAEASADEPEPLNLPKPRQDGKPVVLPLYKATTTFPEPPAEETASQEGEVEPESAATSNIGDAFDDLAVTNPVVAVVEGEEIRWLEVIASASDLPLESMDQVESLFPALLNRLIDLKLLSVAGEEAGLREAT
ncbi:MAG: hypothetical protein R3245_11325, partial [Kiloniellales bacterium]|nr:hypothetical protein [Kiloniellales bacterium]